MLFGKYINETEVEYAPKNYEGILNFNTNEDIMIEYGYKPLVDPPAPKYDESYQTLSYKWVDGSIITRVWKVTDYRTPEEARKEKIAALSLTQREVFLALFKSSGVTPEAIRSKIKDIEAQIEFDHAERYYRGNALIESIGGVLGYSSDDLDTLFETGSLPSKK